MRNHTRNAHHWWIGLCLVGSLALGSCGSNVPKSYTDPYGGRTNDGPQPKDAGISGIEGRDRIQNNDVDGDNGREVAAFEARRRNAPPPEPGDVVSEDGDEMGGAQAGEGGGPGGQNVQGGGTTADDSEEAAEAEEDKSDPEKGNPEK